MYNNKAVAVVVPTYNEETQIGKVIQTMPDYVDFIVVVDDVSKDSTVNIVEAQCATNSKVILLKHTENQGVGGAIATGYKWAKQNNIDVAAVMAGDGQMDPDDLTAILEPVVSGKADYSKGNRLFTGEAYQRIPKIRYFGNSILSLLTKIASGYWHIADSQSGYTAINKKVLQIIDWDAMYKRYGQPNDLLVMLNVYDCLVCDVKIQPIYGVGEKSGIKIRKVLFSISWLLMKRFLWRLKEKYIIRDFHPLIFFYFFGFVFGIATILLFARMFYYWIFLGLSIPRINALAAMFSFMSASQFSLFAMWFDMEFNKKLKC
ncbi:MAG: glycosyltransferase family 2 protein [Calditrichota bacterium]